MSSSAGGGQATGAAEGRQWRPVLLEGRRRCEDTGSGRPAPADLGAGASSVADWHGANHSPTGGFPLHIIDAPVRVHPLAAVNTLPAQVSELASRALSALNQRAPAERV